VGRPNVLIKIPATAEGVTATRILTGEGPIINITLIFSLKRYEEIIDAYLDGLEFYRSRGGDLSNVHSVASFFVSRVDLEIDRRLETIGTPPALALRGRCAVAQAKLAYQLFRERFTGDRWDALHASGANLQRPLWASTSVKNPAYSPTLYVDNIIGPDTVNTLTEQTIATFEGAGSVARTIDVGVDDATAVLTQLREVGVDIADVVQTLEGQGIEAFNNSFAEVLESLTDKSTKFARRNRSPGEATRPRQ
jgi:transaldolase